MIISPAISLIAAFLFSIIVSFSNYELYYLLPIAFILYLNKNNIFSIFKSLVFLNLFIVVLALVLLIQNEYEEALNIYIRTNMIILFNLAIFYNSKGYDIVRGLYILKFPDSFISTTYFTLKMIENLKNDFSNIKNTLKARGFKAKTNLFTYYTFGNILGMLFVKSIRKSQSLKDSFEARGFNKKIYLNDKFKTTNKDILLLLLVGIIIILKVSL
ncbi:energy-coupling factor transporter transmembrane component T family protein [Malaciobacter mytili]|uniref:Cobalt ABC transporter permease n=1 Tax=Malaciobacter mytili LMG 24559 TaxID=1032238 RepID=A0AAX2ABH3_9BACT|nr:energy-coupling factor transporter transmembrane component T [Malaciobacter mytili]AXH15804.1 cobalt/nickel ECF transporter CbiMNQO, T component CbiQ [Malaciobacter mytili LMG 24559]RXI39412.1 cobalt ABC transporter permease [Malaciobacter mytili]RXK12901.1 cobalt ABC transporter permease [Malaciobacter mytili LMG 24559]